MNQQKRILVVDDEVLLTYSISKYLTSRGFCVQSTSHSDQALSILDNDQFDVVITDLRMVPVSGIEIIRHLRQSGYKGKIIVMSAYFREFDKDLQELKVDALLEKPFDVNSFLQVIAG